jgi:type II secretion system protein D
LVRWTCGLAAALAAAEVSAQTTRRALDPPAAEASVSRASAASAAPTRAGQPAAVPTLVSYAAPAERLEAGLRALKERYRGRSDVRVAADRGGARILLWAPPDEQARIAAWIASWPGSSSSAPAEAQRTATGAPAARQVEQVQYAEPPAANRSIVRLAQQTEAGVRSAEIEPLPATAPPAAPSVEASAAATGPTEELVLSQASEAVQHTELLRRLGFNVQIEVLPGQDVLVLRGRDVDVEAVAEIIREIERAATLAKPEIEILPLAQTPGRRIVELFEEVETALIEGRQGRVAVKALGTPNAILLIGWGEALESAKTLIAKLDQPVAPDQQMRVFRLRHAAAASVQAVVQEYFEGREGLAPSVQAAADRRTNLVIVNGTPRDLAEVELLVEQLDVARTDAVKQVRVFQLRNALAADLADTLENAIEGATGGAQTPSAALELLTIDGQSGRGVLRSGLLDGVEIVPNAQTNTLVISGPPDAMPLIEALIERLDQPVSTAQIKVFRIEHGDANSLVLMLRALLPTQAGPAPRPQLPGAEGESTLTPLRFAVEQRTNSIIASGSAGDLQIVHALLLRLDEDETQRRRTTVYRLKNAPASDVARAVNEFLSSERQVQQISPGEASALEQLEREVVVVPEPVSNSLIVSATRRFYEEIVDLVEKLDAQPPQVVIQVLIAQVGLQNTDEFGVEAGLQDSVLFDRSLLGDLITTTATDTLSTPAGVVTSTNQVIQSATNTPGFNFVTGDMPNSASSRALANSGKVGGQGVTTFSVGRINNELGFGGLVLSASSQSVSLLIRALQESRRLDVLSRPQITTLDNQTAFIQVGQRVPRVVQSTLSNFGQTNSVELENVGLILIVTPRTSPNGMVVMEVDAERSEVGPESEGIPIATDNDGTIVRSPRIDITTAQTTVTAASGETIVLGGLITRRENNIHRRVPLLADIPLLGDLFRYDLVENQRFELLIILTPHVVLGPTDMQRIREMESARMHWCAADVQALHGVSPLYGQPGVPMEDAEIPIIYPDDNPRGILPENLGPADQPLPARRPPTEADIAP